MKKIRYYFFGVEISPDDAEYLINSPELITVKEDELVDFEKLESDFKRLKSLLKGIEEKE